jgi:hypothetical protein
MVHDGDPNCIENTSVTSVSIYCSSEAAYMKKTLVINL